MNHTRATVSAVERISPVLTAVLVAFVEGVWHPEDVVRLEGTPWIVVSAMRSVRGTGALLAVRDNGIAPAVKISWEHQAETGRRGAAAFDPHGIDVRQLGGRLHELLVVDHGDGEAIDRLTIDTATGRPVIVNGTRIEQPAGTSGNAVAFLPDGGFLMTSMFDPRDPDILGKFARGAVTGSIWCWGETLGWKRLGPLLSGANGIAVSADGQTIYVSEWSARRVRKLSIDGVELRQVDVDFLPDNLRWNGDGELLLAGQAARPERVFGCEARGEPCPLAFAVVRLDPVSMRITPFLTVSHEEALQAGFGGATGALAIENEVWISSFTGERLARYRAD